MAQSRRVLVTGGAGFIGSHLVDALAERGDEVEVVDDLSTGRRENLRDEVPLHVVDIRSQQAADRVERFAPEILYHLAAQMDVRRSVADPVFDADVNVLGTLNLLRSAVRAGVRQVVFASTGGAIYGEQEAFPAPESHPARPLSPYGVAKLAAERYLYYFHRQHGLDAVCLRYANVYGERQRPDGEAGVVAIFLGQLLAGHPCRIHGDGLQTRDFIHVSDVVRANLAASETSGFAIYNVGTGVETAVVELHRLLCRAVGRDAEAEHGPAKPGEQRRSSVDPSRARAELGLAPLLDLPAGLERTATWFRRPAATPGGYRP